MLLQLACNVIDDAVVTEDDTKLLEQALLSTRKQFVGKKHGRGGNWEHYPSAYFTWKST